jgi:hypothetical protein
MLPTIVDKQMARPSESDVNTLIQMWNVARLSVLTCDHVQQRRIVRCTAWQRPDSNWIKECDVLACYTCAEAGLARSAFMEDVRWPKMLETNRRK